MSGEKRKRRSVFYADDSESGLKGQFDFTAQVTVITNADCRVCQICLTEISKLRQEEKYVRRSDIFSGGVSYTVEAWEMKARHF